MSALTQRNRIMTSSELGGWAGGIALGALLLLAVVARVGDKLTGAPPVGLLERATGQGEWTDTHWTVLVAFLLVASLLVLAWYLIDIKVNGPRDPLTRACKHPSMAQPHQVKPLTEKGRKKAAKRLGGHGDVFMLGKLGRTSVKLFFGREDTGLVIAGPRTIKSSALANPAIIESEGPVLATSNKPDVVTQTIAHRTGPVYIYDPSNIYTGPVPTPMYWNPLTGISHAPTDRMAEKAATLAKRFLFAAGKPTGDPHWPNAARNIMTGLLLAAAIDNRPITDVYRWVMAPNDETPVDILKRDRRFPLIRRMLADYASHPEETRGGEYSTAQTCLSFLAYDSVHPWITPGGGRTEFVPQMMTEGGAPTLYLLSKDGDASTGALTAALTIAVYEAAEQAAIDQGGHLKVPMLLVLDEVANVCRWESLPDLYTHMGSRGILPISFLQNYTQGKDMWGEERMQQLLSASSVFITGANVKGDGFHRSVANMVKKYARETVSESWGKHGRGTNRQSSEEETVDIADLRELTKNYSLMFYPGMRTIVLRSVPVWRRRYRKPSARTDVAAAPAPVTRPVEHRVYASTAQSPTARRSWNFDLRTED